MKEVFSFWINDKNLFKVYHKKDNYYVYVIGSNGKEKGGIIIPKFLYPLKDVRRNYTKFANFVYKHCELKKLV